MIFYFLCTIIIGLVSIFGIAINGYIIFVIIKEKQVKSVNGILLVQHSAVELTLSVCVMVCSLTPLIFDRIQPSNTHCDICGFLMNFLRPVALWTVCGLNCDRYYAISAPLHYGSLINSRKVLTAMSVTWILSLILSLPAFSDYPPFKYDANTFICTPTPGKQFTLYYSIIYTIFVFILPLFLILLCNAKVFTIARHHKHRIASAIFEVTLSAQVTITHQKNPFSPSGLANRFKGRSASLTVFQIVGSFVIIYVPYYSTMLWNLSSSQPANSSSPQISSSQPLEPNHSLPLSVISTASILLFCSSSVNGLLYGVKNKVLKKCFRNYWRKKMTKNELNQEIQARTPSTCGSRRPSLTPAVGIAFFTRQSCRRTSDISVDTQKSNLLGTSFSRFHYNNLAWRPGSSPGLETSVAHSDSFNELKRTHSLRRSASNNMNNSLSNLRLPAAGTPPNGLANDLGRIEEPAGHPLNNHHKPVEGVKNGKPSVLIGSNGVTLLLQRFRKTEPCDYEVLSHRRRSKSPKILITRAYSEENDSTNTDRSCPPKTSSSVTTLLIDSHSDSSPKECVSFGIISRHPLLTDNTTDDSASDDSQSHSNEELCGVTKNSDPSAPRVSANNLKSWPFDGGRRKNIQFRIGSVVLSEHDFMSNSCSNTNTSS